MYVMVRLAGVSAALAAAFVLATNEPSTSPGLGLRPALLVTIDEAAANPLLSRPDTRRDIVLK